MTRSAIYIDIEGFAEAYLDHENRAILALGQLLNGIYQIGTKVCPDSPDRLFAHQTGDGFIIMSEFHDKKSRFLLGIPIVLMRYLLMSGGVAKTAVAEGEFGDIQGCYPDIPIDDNGKVRLGRGFLTTFSVMGTAFINANKLSGREKGALLLVDSCFTDHLPNETVIAKREQNYLVVDWIHTEVSDIHDICKQAGLYCPSTQELERALRTYVANTPASLASEWKTNTLRFNGCDGFAIS